MDQLRCASGGTLSCEPRIPWPPRAMSPTSQGNTFAKPKGHLLPLIRPDSPCSLSPSSRPTPPSPSIFGRCALAPSAFRPAVEGPDDRWHSLRPHETVSSGLSALHAFLLRQFAQPPPQKNSVNQPLLYADETLECLGVAHTTQRISIEKAPGGKIMLEARFNNARCP